MDFSRRVQAVDPVFARTGVSRSGKGVIPRRPILSGLAGFLWFYAVATVATNREVVEASLAQGTLTSDQQTIVINVLAAVLAVSGVALVAHFLRFLRRNGGASANSGGIVTGAAVALALIYTPQSVIDMGARMIDENSRSLILAAQTTVRDTVPGVDFGSVSFVSSQGR